MLGYTTLAQYLIAQQQKYPHIPDSLCTLIQGMAHACKMIGHCVSKGALEGMLGNANHRNVHGETQKKLDLIANDILLQTNEWGGTLAAMASEELEHIHLISHPYPVGEHLLLFDPLDGSSNIDVNISIGTIFSVLNCQNNTNSTNANSTHSTEQSSQNRSKHRSRAADERERVTSEQSFLQPGKQQVAAGYALYGPQTMFVFTMGYGVNNFTLEPKTGLWVLTQNDLRIPEETGEFAINASNARYWYPPVKHYIDELIAGKDGVRKQDFNMRWIGSMVADIHRILHRGGIFMYPADRRNSGQTGKLRLLYEANPMAYIVEQANGAATNGTTRMLDIAPAQLHERVAVFIGSKNEVDRVTRYHHEMES